MGGQLVLEEGPVLLLGKETLDEQALVPSFEKVEPEPGVDSSAQ